jgi:hypothetical protein
MTTAAKLTVDSEGRVQGANITWNSPWPCANGDGGGMSVPHGIMGLLEHTMVGNLLPGTVSWFNNPAAQASAHFGVDQLGNIHQFGPVNGWMAWHCAEGNPNWFGCEFADDGVPANPLTAAQITAAAQLLELLSRPDLGNFPLQISDNTSTEGYGWHGMGGLAFGDHPDCPGDVRKAQRPQIVALAMSIRQGVPVPAANYVQHVTVGESSLAQLAAQNHCEVSAILRLTLQHSPNGLFEPDVATLIDGLCGGAIAPAALMPAGLVLYLPA